MKITKQLEILGNKGLKIQKKENSKRKRMSAYIWLSNQLNLSQLPVVIPNCDL